MYVGYKTTGVSRKLLIVSVLVLTTLSAAFAQGDYRSRPHIGVLLQSLSEDNRETFGITRSITSGAVVVDIYEKSPAVGNLLPGDVILEIGHETIDDPTQVRTHIERAHSSGRAAILLRVARADLIVYAAVAVGAPETSAHIAPTPPRIAIRSTTANHIVEKICLPVIEEAFIGQTSERSTDLKQSLAAHCETCFVDGVLNDVEANDRHVLDMLFANKSANISAMRIERAQQSYSRVFAACSKQLIEKITADLQQRK